VLVCILFDPLLEVPPAGRGNRTLFLSVADQPLLVAIPSLLIVDQSLLIGVQLLWIAIQPLLIGVHLLFIGVQSLLIANQQG